MKKILLICTLLALLIGCTTPRVYKENRFTKQFQEADSMFGNRNEYEWKRCIKAITYQLRFLP